LARQTARLGLRGLEFYVGIPGSVGGAIRMNAGGHGAETVDVLAHAAILTLGEPHIDERTPDELGLAFRHSNLGDRDVVVAATFCAERGEPGAARAEIDEIVRWRRANQPGGQNCGSVFVNPPGDSAGRLIDAAGLKGTRIGGAIVSPKHANFVQADSGTRAADIVALIGHVRSVVHETFGVALRPELRLVGFAPEELAGAGDPPDAPPGVRA
jgi:UDP-N-acetylmuramate dehydrogenase